MRTLAHTTLLAVCVSTMTGLVACGGSANNDAGQTTGGGPANVGGNSNGGGSSATGGVLATGGTTVTGGGANTGGTTSPITSATGGTTYAEVPTGGATMTGGSSSVGGSLTTGGSSGTGGSTGALDIAQMCDQVCTLLEGRAPQLDCMPSDCRGSCSSTYSKLNGAKAVCANDYVALYQCGLTQTADQWTCFTLVFGTLNIAIPVPPHAAGANDCTSQYNTLYSVIISNLTTCAAVL